MPYKDSTKRKENIRKYREKNKEQIKEKKRKHYEKNKEEINEKAKEYRDVMTQNAYDSVMSKCIMDKHKWDAWCDIIKRNAEQKKHHYSKELTNEVMFEMMTRGCYYCGDIATTIDRLDSDLDHTPKNCVGCCAPCNISKGTADPSTFIRKSYYMARGKYVDDVIDVWFVNKNKPSIPEYKRRATKQGVSFDLNKEEWNAMIVDKCAYCQRSPTTWFGIDRVIPGDGYVNGNVVTCCFDCNLGKHNHDVDTTMSRNERIAKRVGDGILIIQDRPRVTLHKGIQKSSKKVCVYGKVYESQNDASRIVKNVNDTTKNLDVRDCIRNGRYPDDIFRISDEFYDFATKNNLENITKKMYVLFDRM
jgi:hypothetical protein